MSGKGGRLSLRNPYISKQATEGKMLGTYYGITRDTQDAQRRGRIAVFIPSFFDSSQPEDVAANWFNCEWSSPFWGQSYRGQSGSGEKNYTNSQSTYGMWMVPPDPGTYVLVVFAEGNLKFPIIVSCLVSNQFNYSVPGFPGGVSYGDPTVNAPVAEKNLTADPGKHGPNVPRPMQADIAEQITQQGLINDPIRGAGKSGARRDSPSKVFGILTPGDWDPREPAEGEGKVRLAGHQLVMDDKLGSRLIRIRSGGGNQILFNDDIGTIYCTNSKGETWWEMDQTGNFNLYAKRGIHIRTQGDFNVRADGSMNLEAGGDVNIKAAGDMRANQYVGGAIQEALGAFGVPTIGNGGRVNITGKQSLQLYGDRNVRMTAGGGDIDINAGGVLNMQGNGVSPINGAGVNISAPTLGSVLIHAGQHVQLQGIFVDLAAPVISAGGGIINLNTTPPTPLPPGIALPAFKLSGKPLQDVDDELVPFSRSAAKQGASAFPTQGKRDGLALSVYSIVSKMITAEPYIGHAQSDPIKKASDPEFLESIVDNLPPGSSGDPANPAPGDVVITDPSTGQSVVKKGIGYVNEAGEQMASAQDQVKGAYEEVKGEFDQATAGIQAEVDAVKADLAEQFPEYEEYADVFNNAMSLLDGDLSAIQRIELLIGMAQSVIPPIRFPTSNQLEEEIVGLNSKLSELESQLAEYGIDADRLMADLLTGNIAGLKAQAMGVFNDAVSEGLNNSELTAKMKENGLDIAGLDPTDPMFPSIAVTDKDGNTFVDFSKGMSDPAAVLLKAGKLNTEFAEIQQEFPNVMLGDTAQQGLMSFVDGIGGPEKFSNSNVGREFAKLDQAYQEGNTAKAAGIQANIPRLMSGWVTSAETPGGKMVYNQSLADRRQAEILMFTAPDDMNLKQILDSSVPGGETYGSMIQKMRAAREDYYDTRQSSGIDTELGKVVKNSV
jgi:hypothetical protein